MADGIEVPISLPTESASVRAAAGVVRALEANLAALGPAAAAGSSQAQASMRALGAAAQGAQKQLASLRAQDAARAALPRGPDQAGGGAEKARAAAEAAAGKAAIKAIDDARKAADTAEKARIKARGAAEKAALKEQAKAIKDNEKAAAAAADKAKSHAQSNAAAMDATSAAIQQATAVIAVVVAAIAAMTAAFTVALVKVQAFKESTIGAFSKLLGGAKAADAAFKATIKTADEIGIGYKEALSSVNALIAQGFKVDQAQTLVKAMADLKSVNPAANLESIVGAISKIKATGFLQGDELNMLNEAGLSASLVYEALAKKMGKTTAEIRKMQTAGKLGADDVIQAILSGIQATTKMPIGAAAKEASNSLAGLLARIEQIPEGLLMMADSSKGVGILKDALRNIVDAFSPSTAGGKAMAAAMGQLGDALAGLITGLTGVKGKSNLESFAMGAAKAISFFADMIVRVTPYLPMMGKGLLGLAALVVLVSGPFIIAGGLVFGAVIAIVGAIGWLIEAVQGAVDPVKNFFTSVYNTISSAAQWVYTTATSIGSNLVQGIIAGIQGGLPGLLGAVASVALATTGTAQTGFGTHSPSVIWRDEIGYQLPAGAAQGIEKGKPLMLRAASSLAANTNAAGAAQGGGAGGISIAAGAIVININGDGRGAKEIGDEVEARLRTILGGIAA